MDVAKRTGSLVSIMLIKCDMELNTPKKSLTLHKSISAASERMLTTKAINVTVSVITIYMLSAS